MTRDIGIKVNPPKDQPIEGDNKNPFNGTLSIRGNYLKVRSLNQKQKILL